MIKLNYNFKKKFFFHKINKNELNFIKILIKYNIIKRVKLLKNNSIIFLKYFNNTNVLKISNLYQPSSKKVIKLEEVKKLSLKKNNIFLLSSNKGIISNIDALCKKTGGVLLAKISLSN